jgi:hypothetical protein
MLLKCTKNLVLGGQLVIMKHDIIEILDSDTVESPGKEPVRWFDCLVKVSSMCGEMEFSMDIFQLAEHFEYLEIRSKHTTFFGF